MFVRAEHDETQIVLPEWDLDSKAVNLRGQPLGGLRKINDALGNDGIEMRKTHNTLGYQGKKLAQVTRGNKGYTIVGYKNVQNRRSTDIPLVNGTKLGTAPMPLREKDIISIAGIEMEFYYIH